MHTSDNNNWEPSDSSSSADDGKFSIGDSNYVYEATRLCLDSVHLHYSILVDQIDCPPHTNMAMTSKDLGFQLLVTQGNHLILKIYHLRMRNVAKFGWSSARSAPSSTAALHIVILMHPHLTSMKRWSAQWVVCDRGTLCSRCHNSGKQEVFEKYTPWYTFQKRYTFGVGLLFCHKNWPQSRRVEEVEVVLEIPSTYGV